jgi:hypothetical protein
MRSSRIPQKERLEQAVRERDVGMLNMEAKRRNMTGHHLVEIGDAGGLKGLGLYAKRPITASHAHPKVLCEYTGVRKEVLSTEKITNMSITELMYGAEGVTVQTRGGVTITKRWRVVADEPLHNLARFANAPGPNEQPNARIVQIGNRLVVEFIRNIEAGQPILIDYGPHYWMYFWHRLPSEHQRTLRIKWPDIPFPPIWPTIHRLATADSRRQAELDYINSASNIYDGLATAENEAGGDTIDEVDNSTATPGSTHPASVPQKTLS